MILVRMFSDIRQEKLIAKIENEGVDLTVDYDDINDEQYWKIRNAIIKHHPDFQVLPQAPPYEYAPQEDKLINVMQGLLQRMIVMDLSVVGKILIIAIWVACFAAPVLLKMPWHLFYL